MGLVVQKYGGTSVAGAERLQKVAQYVVERKNKGNKMVVVVSAMGKTTNELINLANQVCKRPDQREMDVLLSTGEIVSSTLLAMAIKDMGHEVVSLSGGQAGILTDNGHGRARIRNIEPQRILRELDEGNIVVVAGFQGITDEMDVTTLGRGGSDITGVALAARLHADACEIYTDVEGVYTADPRLVPEARMLPEIDYGEMLELACYGAKVMHPRAVELGEVYGMPILVASSFTNRPGTLIHGGMSMEVRNKVRGIAHDLNVAKVTVLGAPDRPGIASAIFEALSNVGISVDTIVQNASTDGITDLTFTVARSDLTQAMGIVQPVARSVGARGCISNAALGKVSIVGSGMQNTPGYAARMFSTLHHAGINIELITTSEIRITCLINEEYVTRAVQALHRAFQLDEAE